MWFRRKNYLGETRKKEILRRLEALEVHVQDLEERYRDDMTMHLREFHVGQEGFISQPEGESNDDEKV